MKHSGMMHPLIILLRLLIGFGGLGLLINILLVFPYTNSSGKYLQLFAAIALMAFAVFYGPIVHFSSDGVLRIIRYAVYAGFLIMLAVIGFLFFIGSTSNATFQESAVIVLGGGLRGEMVSQSLADRLDTAADYLLHNKNAVAVLSGGQGADEVITEAEAMKRYLMGRNIPADRILKEERSTSTYENFKYSKELLDTYFTGDYTVTYVTNTYHAYRAGQYAQMSGLHVTRYNARTLPYLVVSSYMREFFAVVKLWVLRS